MRDRIVGGGDDTSRGRAWRTWMHYLRFRETWGLVLARFAGDGAFYFFSVWLPLYMQSERGFSILGVAWPVSVVEDWWVALLLSSLAIASNQVKTSSLFPLAADIYPARDVATVWGMSGAAGACGAALFQWGFGWLIDAYGYDPVFVIVSLMCLVQAALIAILVPRVVPLGRVP